LIPLLPNNAAQRGKLAVNVGDLLVYLSSFPLTCPSKSCKLRIETFISDTAAAVPLME
jgi:hypothetical protein